MISRARMGPAIGAALLVTLLTPAVASAHQRVTTIATGLDNPRGMTFGPDGALYVAEAGKGGAGPCFSGPEGNVCFGPSGAITKISHGRQTRVATGLPSLAGPDGTQAFGPADVATVGGALIFPSGNVIPPAARGGLPGSGKNAGWLLWAAGRNVFPLADISGYTAQTLPDGGNPNSVTLTPRGAVVTDSAGNSLLRVAPNGTISTLATFPSQMVDAPPSLGLPPGTQIPSEAVPTSAIVGPDGAFYVSQLTGFPFPASKASVFRVVPGKQPTVVATGFTNVIDLAFDRRGSLYVLEVSHKGLLSGDLTGALIKVKRDGTHQVVNSGLTGPAGLLIKDNAAYVSDCGVCPATGTVKRIPLP
ncbi:hypothetical protein JOF56_006395 [Kibdelosporangium banguiense]|uniref:ScyD/ScyE family protein n=1 Tax=Kibdelosporangium banguiense TaxID=1365924 RepID=A0ABS4TNN2_9PSEU|nr:ScyD/ScyE family protein [Kibdelosporangium banguiense]MBP2326010.1 hypothetical protein [Kibdelosporangium banguiense]